MDSLCLSWTPFLICLLWGRLVLHKVNFSEKLCWGLPFSTFIWAQTYLSDSFLENPFKTLLLGSVARGSLFPSWCPQCWVTALATLFNGHSENYHRLASSPRNRFQAYTPSGQQILPWYTTELYLVTVSSTRLYCFWYQGQGAVITAICTVVYWSLTGDSSIVFDECISPAVLLDLCFLTTLAFV